MNISALLRSHYRNYGEHKGSAVYLTQDCQNLVHKFLSKFYERNFLQNLINISVITYAFGWILAQTRELGNQSGQNNRALA